MDSLYLTHTMIKKMYKLQIVIYVLIGCRYIKNEPIKSLPQLNISRHHATTEFPVMHLLNMAAFQQGNTTNTTWHRHGHHIQQLVSMQLCASRHCHKSCHCNEACMKERLCCLDYMWNNTQPVEITEYMKKFVRRAQQEKQWACLPVFKMPNADRSKHIIRRIRMINDCPPTTLGRLLAKCRNKLDINPIFGDDKHIYKNIHCVLCNNEAPREFLPIQVNCSRAKFQLTPIGRFANYNQCIFDVKKNRTEANVKHCDTYTNTEVCGRDHQLYELCTAYAGRTGPFDNIHCLMCMGKEFDFDSVARACSSRRSGYRTAYSFTIRFTGIDGKYYTDGSVLGVQIPICKTGEAYDITDGSCLKLHCHNSQKCPNNIDLTNTIFKRTSSGQCMLRFPNMLNQTIVIRVKINNQSEHTVTNNTLTSLRNLLTDAGIVQLKYSSILTNGHDYIFIGQILQAEINEITDQLALQSSPVWGTVETISIGFHPEDSFTEMYEFSLSRAFAQSVCAEVEFLCTTGGADSCCDQLHLFATANMTDNNTDVLHRNMNIIQSVQRGKVLTEIYHCKSFHLQTDQCPLLQVSKSNFTILNNTGNIFLKYSKQVINATQYLPHRYGIAICRYLNYNLDSETSWKYKLRTIENYITMIGVPLSIVCYIWTIATYTIIKELRRLPNFNLVALSVSLLLTDIIFLQLLWAKDIYSRCRILSVMLHWSLLVVQSWTVITSADVLYRIRSPASQSNKGRRRARWYVVCSLLFPACIVIATTVIDSLTGWIGYGRNGICWINNWAAAFATYVAFVIVAMCFSVATLMCIVSHVYTERRKSRRVLGKSSQKFSLYRMTMKLAFLIGVMELVGFVQIPSASTEKEEIINAVFQLLFTSLRSLRGCLIWLMFVARKDVVKHYRARESKDCESTSRAPVALFHSSVAIITTSFSNSRQ